jgi:hypothetical protein
MRFSEDETKKTLKEVEETRKKPTYIHLCKRWLLVGMRKSDGKHVICILYSVRSTVGRNSG